jgi:type III secretion protein J
MRFLLLAVLLVFSGCREQIVHNLSEIDANRLVTKLHDASLSGDKEKQADGKWSISVPSDETIRALKLLNDSRILRSESQKPIEKSSVISSREDQRFHYERSLSQEIETTLSSVPGVLEARVHLNIPPVDPLFGKSIGPGGTASVLLVTDNLLAASKEEIAGLVSGASGIKAEAISVLFSRSADTLHEGGLAATESTLPNHSSEVVQLNLAVSPTENFNWYLWLQISASILIIAVAGGYWLYKNRSRRTTAVVAKALAELGAEG